MTDKLQTEQRLPIQLVIGTQVWFHDPTMKPFHQARMGFVSGPGAVENVVNVTIFTDPLRDITEKNRPPVLERRNIIVYERYPDHWPDHPFVVWIGSAMQHIQAASKAGATPHGGILPLIIGGTAINNQGFSSGGEPFYIEPSATNVTANNGTTASAAAESAGIDPAILGSGEPEDDATTPAINEDDEIRPGPDSKDFEPAQPEDNTPPKDDDKKPAKGGLDQVLHNVTLLPAWTRDFDDLDGIIYDGDGDRLTILSKKKKPLVILTHRADGDKPGVILLAQTNKSGEMGVAIEGAHTNTQVNQLARLAARIATAGLEAKTKIQCHQAYNAAMSMTA